MKCRSLFSRNFKRRIHIKKYFRMPNTVLNELFGVNGTSVKSDEFYPALSIDRQNVFLCGSGIQAKDIGCNTHQY